MLRKALLIALVYNLAACQNVSVYDRPIPAPENTKELFAIKDGIKPEDQESWQAIVFTRVNPMAKKMESKTVGEAIRRYKAQDICMKVHSTENVPQNPITLGSPGYDAAEERHFTAYNAEVKAYNACLKMRL